MVMLGRNEVVQIPKGLNNLQFTVFGNVNLQLRDPAAGVTVASDITRVVNDAYPDVSCEFKPEKTSCHLPSTSIALELSFVNPISEVKVYPELKYTHGGIAECPLVIPGCCSLGTALDVPKKDVFKWVCALRREYNTSVAAWAWGNETETPVLNRALWLDVWGKSGQAQDRAFLAFDVLDSDNSDNISQEEFAEHFQLPGQECDTSTTTFLDDWWTNWVVWTLFALTLWACCALAVLCCLCSSRKQKDSGQESDHHQRSIAPGRDKLADEFQPVHAVVTDPLLPQPPDATLRDNFNAQELSPYRPENAQELSPYRPQSPPMRSPSVGTTGPHSATLDRLLGNPAVRQKIEEHPSSLRFHQTRLLGYNEQLTDGFRAVFFKELLLVDARRDASLYGFMNFLHTSFPPTDGLGSVVHIAGVAKAIAAGLGGSVHHEHEPGEDVEARWQQRLHQLRLDFPHDMPIGTLLGRHDPAANLHLPGAGLQRHRAVLFKYVCDSLRICSSALLWDAKRDTAINLAWTGGSGGRPMVVDCTAEPGQLTEAYDLHHLVQQLEGEHHAATPLGQSSAHFGIPPRSGHNLFGMQ